MHTTRNCGLRLHGSPLSHHSSVASLMTPAALRACSLALAHSLASRVLSASQRHHINLTGIIITITTTVIYHHLLALLAGLVLVLLTLATATSPWDARLLGLSLGLLLRAGASSLVRVRVRVRVMVRVKVTAHLRPVASEVGVRFGSGPG